MAHHLTLPSAGVQLWLSHIPGTPPPRACMCSCVRVCVHATEVNTCLSHRRALDHHVSDHRHGRIACRVRYTVGDDVGGGVEGGVGGGDGLRGD